MKREIITAPRASTLICGLAAANAQGVWLLPANVCPAVPLALMQAGTSFEFIDINQTSLNMDIKQACQRITAKDRASIAGLIYVNSYGYSQNSGDDLQILKQALPENVILIDDQCLSAPETMLENLPYRGANAVIYSTGYGKVLDLGGGGYGVFFDNPAYDIPTPLSEDDAARADAALTKLYKKAMTERRPMFEAISANQIEPWICSDTGPHWQDLQARIDASLPKALTHKQTLNQIYTKGLSGLDGLTPLSTERHIWRFIVLAKRRDEFLTLLFMNGLFASAHYYPATELFDGVQCPEAHTLHKSVLNLFNDMHFSKEQAEHVVSLAHDFYSPQK